MAAEAEEAGVDGGVSFQGVEEGFGVFGEGEGGGGVEGAPGGADAAVVAMLVVAYSLNFLNAVTLKRSVARSGASC